MKFIPYILIVVVLLIAGGLYIDNQNKKTNTESAFDFSQEKIKGTTELKNYGPAPEFKEISTWLNTEQLTMSELKGKVVLVDFWTYSCINCIRTLPYLTAWDEKYRDQGLVIVGVHTPEFGFEKVTNNVKTALERHKIKYPVAQDNDFGTWNAYNNKYWPAKYLIDQQGNIIYTHFGEGDYEETESIIQQLLNVTADTEKEIPRSISRDQSPEMYFGFSRIENLAQNFKQTVEPQNFSWLENQELNQFQLEGKWSIQNEKAVLSSQTGKIRLRYKASQINMVATNPKGSALKIFIDGKEQSPVIVKNSQLYTLYNEAPADEHEIIIEITGSGFEAFTFTFG